MGGLAASGCADPVCASSGVEELTTHGQAGVEALVDLDLERGADELGVGLGISPHPHPPMVAGAIAITTPPPVAPPAPEKADPEPDPAL